MVLPVRVERYQRDFFVGTRGCQFRFDCGRIMPRFQRRIVLGTCGEASLDSIGDLSR